MQCCSRADGGKEKEMRRWLRKWKEVLDSFREDQSGIGVVEIILILVNIFTENTGCFYVYIE